MGGHGSPHGPREALNFLRVRPTHLDVGKRTLIIAGVAVWVGLVGFGLRELHAYSTTAGSTAATPETWPAESALMRGRGFTVVMFVHPECPCSRASLAELAEIARAAPVPPEIFVAIADDHAGGLAWELAGEVTGAKRVLDRDGREAARFGARTSGHVVVYDPRGNLRFAGGITGSRGHAGDNVGRRSVLEVLATGTTDHGAHDVFGCAL